MRKRGFIILTALCLAFSVSSCGSQAAPVQEKNTGAAYQMNTGQSSDIARTDEHEDITWDLITLAEHDPELKRLPVFHLRPVSGGPV